MRRLARDAHADQVVTADDAVGGVELPPAGTRQIHLHPGMGGAAAQTYGPRAAHEQIAGDETRGEPQAAYRLHHQQGEITARSAAQPQRRERLLDAHLFAPDIGEIGADGPGDARQQVCGANLRRTADERRRPAGQFALRVGVVPLDRALQIRHVLLIVGERIKLGMR